MTYQALLLVVSLAQSSFLFARWQYEGIQMREEAFDSTPTSDQKYLDPLIDGNIHSSIRSEDPVPLAVPEILPFLEAIDLFRETFKKAFPFDREDFELDEKEFWQASKELNKVETRINKFFRKLGLVFHPDKFKPKSKSEEGIINKLSGARDTLLTFIEYLRSHPKAAVDFKILSQFYRNLERRKKGLVTVGTENETLHNALNDPQIVKNMALYEVIESQKSGRFENVVGAAIDKLYGENINEPRATNIFEEAFAVFKPENFENLLYSIHGLNKYLERKIAPLKQGSRFYKELTAFVNTLPYDDANIRLKKVLKDPQVKSNIIHRYQETTVKQFEEFYDSCLKGKDVSRVGMFRYLQRPIDSSKFEKIMEFREKLLKDKTRVSRKLLKMFYGANGVLWKNLGESGGQLLSLYETYLQIKPEDDEIVINKKVSKAEALLALRDTQFSDYLGLNHLKSFLEDPQQLGDFGVSNDYTVLDRFRAFFWCHNVEMKRPLDRKDVVSLNFNPDYFGFGDLKEKYLRQVLDNHKQYLEGSKEKANYLDKFRSVVRTFSPEDQDAYKKVETKVLSRIEKRKKKFEDIEKRLQDKRNSLLEGQNKKALELDKKIEVVQSKIEVAKSALSEKDSFFNTVKASCEEALKAGKPQHVRLSAWRLKRSSEHVCEIAIAKLRDDYANREPVKIIRERGQRNIKRIGMMFWLCLSSFFSLTLLVASSSYRHWVTHAFVSSGMRSDFLASAEDVEDHAKHSAATAA